jgi:hypothetical protein
VYPGKIFTACPTLEKTLQTFEALAHVSTKSNPIEKVDKVVGISTTCMMKVSPPLQCHLITMVEVK